MKVLTLLGLGLLCLLGNLHAQKSKVFPYVPSYSTGDVFVDAKALQHGIPNLNVNLQLGDKLGLCVGGAYGITNTNPSVFHRQDVQLKYNASLMVFPFGTPRQVLKKFTWRKSPAHTQRLMCGKHGCARNSFNNPHFLKGIYGAIGYEWETLQFTLTPDADLNLARDIHYYKVDNDGIVLDLGYILRFHRLTLGATYGAKFSLPKLLEGTNEHIETSFNLRTHPVTHRIIHQVKILIGFNF